jgi:hypothetical protein
MAALPPIDQAVRRAVYRGFVERGHPPDAPRIAAELGETEESVRAALRRLHEGHALVLRAGDGGRVLVAHPFSALPTPFCVENARGPWWGYCIWDSLAIAAIVGGDTRIRTRSGAIGAEMILDVRADGTLSDTTPRVHLAVPAARWWDDITFACGTILLFAAGDSIDAWCERHGIPRGEIVAVQTMWDLARAWYSDRLAADWRRRTPSEAEETFRRLGLTSSFWKLS